MHMDELKKQKIWFCWNFETRKDKRTKVPKSAYGTATGTSTEYVHSWVTYDEATTAAKEQGIAASDSRSLRDTSSLILTTRTYPIPTCNYCWSGSIPTRSVLSTEAASTSTANATQPVTDLYV